MLVKKSQWPILIISLIYLLIFTFIFLSRKNYEFLMYVGIIIFFFILILATNKKINYSNSVLWMLSVWAFFHMAGGGLLYQGRIWYKIILIDIIGEPYNIFKYDQAIHIFGFFVATLVVYILLKPLLKTELKNWTTLSIVVIMAGLGVGALNEIIEFTAVVIVPETGVGGFVNSSLDLVSDLIGAVLAMIYIRIKKGNL